MFDNCKNIDVIKINDKYFNVKNFNYVSEIEHKLKFVSSANAWVGEFFCKFDFGGEKSCLKRSFFIEKYLHEKETKKFFGIFPIKKQKINPKFNLIDDNEIELMMKYYNRLINFEKEILDKTKDCEDGFIFEETITYPEFVAKELGVEETYNSLKDDVKFILQEIDEKMK